MKECHKAHEGWGLSVTLVTGPMNRHGACIIGERRIHVVAVIDRWMAPDYRYFRVERDDGCAYVLRLHPDTGEWELL